MKVCYDALLAPEQKVDQNCINTLQSEIRAGVSKGTIQVQEHEGKYIVIGGLEVAIAYLGLLNHNPTCEVRVIEGKYQGVAKLVLLKDILVTNEPRSRLPKEEQPYFIRG